MKREEISYLKELFKVMEKKIGLLEEIYKEKDVAKFNKVKKEILETQKKISSTIK